MKHIRVGDLVYCKRTGHIGRVGNREQTNAGTVLTVSTKSSVLRGRPSDFGFIARWGREESAVPLPLAA